MKRLIALLFLSTASLLFAGQDSRYPTPSAGVVGNSGSSSGGSSSLLPTSSQYNSTETFRPDMITSPALKVWVESGDINTKWCYENVAGTDVSEDTDGCVVWKDQSGNGFDLNSASIPPRYFIPVTGSTDGNPMNGKGWLKYQGQISSATTASDWTFLSNGLGGEWFDVVAVYNPTGSNVPLFDTSNGVTGIGAFTWVDNTPATGRYSLFIRKEAGASVVSLQPTATGIDSTEPHIYGGNYLSPDAELWTDGAFISSGTQSTTPSASAPARPLTIAANAINGGAVRISKQGAFIAYGGKLSITQRRQVNDYLSKRYSIPVRRVAVIGDSTSIQISSWVYGGTGYQTHVKNVGVSGAYIRLNPGTDVYNDQWLSLIKGKGYNFCVVLVGVNDLLSGSQDSTAMISSMTVLLNDILSQPGMRVIINTIVPYKGTSGWTAAIQLEVDAYNAFLRSYAASNSNAYLVDTYSLLGSPDDLNRMRSDYNSDNLHENKTGANVISNAVSRKLLEIGLAP